MSKDSERYDALIIGAGGGIGRALSEELLRQPEIDRLHLASRSDAARLSNEDSDRDSSNQCQVQHYQLDITDPGSLQSFKAELADAVSDLRLVINTAGILHGKDFGPERRLQDIELHSMQQVMTTNCIGHALLLSQLHSLLPKHGRVVLASLSARVGSISDNRLGGWYSYRASKAALNQIIRTASIELKRHNRDSICIGLHPGTVDTPLSEPFQQNVPDDQLFSRERAARQLLDVIGQRTPDDTGLMFAWDGQRVAF